jgi:hypothetical protein
MNQTSSKQGRYGKRTNVSVENREMQLLRVGIKRILKQILKKYDVIMWTTIIRLKKSDSLLSTVNKGSTAKQRKEFLQQMYHY